MLGDVHIAEPGALICFAGPRVIQQTIREQLPEGFQQAEYLLAHGMIDMVVHRHKLRETLARLCRLLSVNAAAARPDQADRRQARERGYLNGSAVDGKTIETLARVLRRDRPRAGRRRRALRGSRDTDPKRGARRSQAPARAADQRSRLSQLLSQTARRRCRPRLPACSLSDPCRCAT